MPHRKVIHVIEDDPVGGESLTAYLRSRGYNAEWSANARSVLVKLKATPRTAAVVLDQDLGGETGLGLLRELRDSPAYRTLPAVVLTAATDGDLDAIGRELAGLQPAALLQKPCDPADVAEAIERLTASSAAMTPPAPAPACDTSSS